MLAHMVSSTVVMRMNSLVLTLYHRSWHILTYTSFCSFTVLGAGVESVHVALSFSTSTPEQSIKNLSNLLAVSGALKSPFWRFQGPEIWLNLYEVFRGLKVTRFGCFRGLTRTFLTISGA